MGSPLGPTMANVFLSFYEIKWLEQCPKEFKPVFYRSFVPDIFVLFESAEHHSQFRNYFNTCHSNISFSLEQEKEGKLSFLDIELSQEKGKFVTAVCRKTTFSGLYTDFVSFCLQYTNLVWFILLFIVVSKFVLVGPSFMKNSVFWNMYFWKTGILCHSVITVLTHFFISCLLNVLN